MFWRKAKPPESTSDVLKLASKMGLERRQFVRVKYPELQKFTVLPEIGFADSFFRVIDISVGGCCLFDPHEMLGSQVGVEVDLTLAWGGKIDHVKSRIVSRVGHRRHIQFLNLEKAKTDRLKDWMGPGIRGQGLKLVTAAEGAAGPALDADEVWTSLQGDSVIFENHVHRYTQINLNGKPYSIFREAWPVRDGNKPSRPKDLEQLVLFLVNAPQPSLRLKSLIITLQQMIEGDET